MSAGDAGTGITAGGARAQGGDGMTTLELRLTIDIDGAAAADVAGDLLIDVDAGELDQAALTMVRKHLHRLADFRVYRIVRCAVTVQESVGA